MQRRIALLNQKGGVAKTTSTCNLAYGLAAFYKKRVLIIDLDPQGQVATYWGLNQKMKEQRLLTLFHVITQELDPHDAIIKDVRPGLDILPSDRTLASAMAWLMMRAGREYAINEICSKLAEYDYILMDCSPSESVMTQNAAIAATELFVPVEAAFASLDGITLVFEAIADVKKYLKKEIPITLVIPTKLEKATNHTVACMEELKRVFRDRISPIVRKNVALSEAWSHHQAIWEYDPHCNGASDYREVLDRVVEMEVNSVAI
jgi:chromosome partitioning protein